MAEGSPTGNKPRVDLKDAARFWELQRLLYNGVLLLIVVLWVVLTWPHFRPAMNLVALGKMTVLALLANLCYCAGYAMEGFIQVPVLAGILAANSLGCLGGGNVVRDPACELLDCG